MIGKEFRKLITTIFTSGTFDKYREDIDVYLKILMVNAIGIVAGACLLIFGILDIIRGIQPVGSVITAAGAVVVINLFFLRLTENYRVASWTAAFILTGGFMFLLSTGGGGNTGPLWIYSLPGAALILLGTRAGSFLFLGFILYAAAALFIPDSPLLFTDYTSDFVIRFIPTLFTVLVMVYIFEAMRFLSQKNILRKNIELEEGMERIKRAERTARENEQRFRDMAGLLPQTVFEIDREGTVTYANRVGLEVFGYTPADLEKGLSVKDLFSPREWEKARVNINRVLRGEDAGDHEYRARKKDGTEFPILAYSSPIIRDGSPVGLRGIIVDLTGRKKLEEDLLKVRKLKSVGILAGGIAHDFNNILTAVLGNISLVKMDLHPGSREYVSLQEAEEACGRARRLTGRLLTFSEGGQPVRRMTAVGDLIRKTVSAALEDSATVGRVEVDDNIEKLEIDPEQFSEVIRNLIMNASEAMEGGGRIDVRVERDRPSGPERLSLPEGDYCRVTVRDRGPGIPEKIRERIFDPYFTTRQMGRGLGLAVAYSVIKNHRGLLLAVPETPGGAEFRIYLPFPGAPASTQDPSKRKTRSGQKMLFMDDQEDVREVAAKMLEKLGYAVEQAVNGQEALEKYRKEYEGRCPYDAVILDLTVPGGMGGVMAASRIRKIDPSARLIVSSGYSNDPVLADYRKFGFSAVIVKPYQIEQFRDVLSGVLPDSADGEEERD